MSSNTWRAVCLETCTHGLVASIEKPDVAIYQGAWCLADYASIRMEIRRQEAIKQGQDIIGNKTKVKVVKNKVAPPFKTAEFDIMYGEGISREGSLVDIGAEMDVISKSGAWYSYNGERLGQGRENVKEYLKQHPEVALEIEQKIRNNLIPVTATVSTEEDGPFDEF